MAEPKKDLSKPEVKEATLNEMFDYVCSKVDWGKSFLDSTAIWCMNKLFIELAKDKNKFKLE
jgi:hypothetical protein